MINKFSQAEIEGRNIFENVLNNGTATGVTFTEDKYCPVDVKWGKDGQGYVGEIKFRPTYSSTNDLIKSQGVVLEKYKYDSLMSIYNREKLIPYYIHIFNDNTLYLFNLLKIDNIEWFEKELPRTTQGNRDKVMKAVTFLPLEKGIKCSYNK